MIPQNKIEDRNLTYLSNLSRTSSKKGRWIRADGKQLGIIGRIIDFFKGDSQHLSHFKRSCKKLDRAVALLNDPNRIPTARDLTFEQKLDVLIRMRQIQHQIKGSKARRGCQEAFKAIDNLESMILQNDAEVHGTVTQLVGKFEDKLQEKDFEATCRKLKALYNMGITPSLEDYVVITQFIHKLKSSTTEKNVTDTIRRLELLLPIIMKLDQDGIDVVTNAFDSIEEADEEFSLPYLKVWQAAFKLIYDHQVKLMESQQAFLDHLEHGTIERVHAWESLRNSYQRHRIIFDCLFLAKIEQVKLDIDGDANSKDVKNAFNEISLLIESMEEIETKFPDKPTHYYDFIVDELDDFSKPFDRKMIKIYQKILEFKVVHLKSEIKSLKGLEVGSERYEEAKELLDRSLGNFQQMLDKVIRNKLHQLDHELQDSSKNAKNTVDEIGRLLKTLNDIENRYPYRDQMYPPYRMQYFPIREPMNDFGVHPIEELLKNPYYDDNPEIIKLKKILEEAKLWPFNLDDVSFSGF